jgi:hypothetical protein
VACHSKWGGAATQREGEISTLCVTACGGGEGGDGGNDGGGDGGGGACVRVTLSMAGSGVWACPGGQRTGKERTEHMNTQQGTASAP